MEDSARLGSQDLIGSLKLQREAIVNTSSSTYNKGFQLSFRLEQSSNHSKTPESEAGSHGAAPAADQVETYGRVDTEKTEPEDLSQDEVADQGIDKKTSLLDGGASEPSEKAVGHHLWDGVIAAMEEASQKRHGMIPDSPRMSQSFARRQFLLQYRYGWADAQALRTTQCLRSKPQSGQASSEEECTSENDARQGIVQDAASLEDSRPLSVVTARPTPQAAGLKQQLPSGLKRLAESDKENTPIEGIPERVWQSLGKIPAFGVLETGTPIEGIMEREWQSLPRSTSQKPQQSLRSYSSYSSEQRKQDALKTPHFVGGLNCAPYISMSATSFGPGHSATSAGFNEDEGAAPMLDVDSDDDYAAAAMEWEAPADSNARPAHGLSNISASYTLGERLADSGAVVSGQPVEHLTDTFSTASQAHLPEEAGLEAEPLSANVGAPDEDQSKDRPAATSQARRRNGTTKKKASHHGAEVNQRLKKMYRQRRSLAGEGLQSDEGKRRSTRHRHRPLEWWRQETKTYKREFRSRPSHFQAAHTKIQLTSCVQPGRGLTKDQGNQ